MKKTLMTVLVGLAIMAAAAVATSTFQLLDKIEIPVPNSNQMNVVLFELEGHKYIAMAARFRETRGPETVMPSGGGALVLVHAESCPCKDR
jgi:hypothetical protein